MTSQLIVLGLRGVTTQKASNEFKEPLSPDKENFSTEH